MQNLAAQLVLLNTISQIGAELGDRSRYSLVSGVSDRVQTIERRVIADQFSRNHNTPATIAGSVAVGAIITE
jgi:hypothetical protein